MDALNQKLNKIKLLVLDVDGVLTDGAISYGNPELELKTFHVQDGFGITLGRQAGLQFGVLTGRTSIAVDRRVQELKIDYYEAGHFYKRDALLAMIEKSGFSKAQVMYMGDEILDLVCQPEVGLFVAPNNAVARVKQEADMVLGKNGGDGAVREVIDALLTAQGILKSTEDFFIAVKS